MSARQPCAAMIQKATWRTWAAIGDELIGHYRAALALASAERGLAVAA